MGADASFGSSLLASTKGASCFAFFGAISHVPTDGFMAKGTAMDTTASACAAAGGGSGAAASFASGALASSTAAGLVAGIGCFGNLE